MSTDLNPDDPRIEMLARVSQRITVTPLDAAHVVDVARSRRKRRRTAIGSALAVTVAITGMSVATGGSEPVLKNSIDAADTTKTPESLPFPVPPEGMKWVGQKRLVVAVPTEWPVTEKVCGTGALGEVVDGAKAARVNCASPGEEARVSLTSLADDPEPSIQRSCEQPAVNPPTCYGGEIFSEQGISVRVAITGEEAAKQVDRILDSAMILPAGWTTVPFAGFSNVSKRVDLLETAGFKIEVDEGTRGQFVEVSPEFGSPVREGSTITISSADDPRTPDSSAPTTRALDALDMTLILLEPRPDGSIPSRIRVQNRTDEVVIDPGCNQFANYSYGMVLLDRPDAVLDLLGGVSTRCAGPEELPPGYDQTAIGPTFQTDDLRVGGYRATIDYHNMRSKRLTADQPVYTSDYRGPLDS